MNNAPRNSAPTTSAPQNNTLGSHTAWDSAPRNKAAHTSAAIRTVVASFTSEAELRHALPSLRDLGPVETYTPQALEDQQQSPILPMIVLIFGIIGVSAGFGMQVYANSIGYPVDIGGRPEFSWPAFVPIAFEIGVLTAILAGFIGYFVINQLPHLYDPVDEAMLMRNATRDRWCVSVRTETPDRALHLLRSLSAEAAEEVAT